jgi:HupE / UreJ protein
LTMTMAFGLVYGFSLSFTLRDMQQFAGTHLLTSLLSFNLGAELGLVLVLVLLVPGLNLLFRHVVPERIGTILLSALVTHTAWHWLGVRFNLLRQYQFQAPELTPQFLVGVLRWTMVIVALAGAFWLVSLWRGRGGDGLKLGIRN